MTKIIEPKDKRQESQFAMDARDHFNRFYNTGLPTFVEIFVMAAVDGHHAIQMTKKGYDHLSKNSPFKSAANALYKLKKKNSLNGKRVWIKPPDFNPS